MSEKILVLVADSGKARLLMADAHGIVEQRCFENPEGRAGGRHLTTHRQPSVNESVGSARHAYQPHTTPREKYATQFARELRDAVEETLADGTFAGVALVAPPRFLGVLHRVFPKPLRAQVVAEVRHDLAGQPPAAIRMHLPSRLFLRAVV